MAALKIAILTGGGDAPGLNAVIYGLTRTCLTKFPSCSVIGYKFGYRGLYTNDFINLTVETTSGILHKGGTILYSSNKDNLFQYPVFENDEQVFDSAGKPVYEDVSGVAVENLKKEKVDVLVVLGGDGTLTSARDFARLGVNVIGVPKTIDNDLAATETTFGFDTAVSIVTENLARLHTTAESHHRVIVCEVMGRNAGWIALHSGIAGSADVILVPEIPYEPEKVIEKIKQRDAQGKPFTIIVVTEGARSKGGSTSIRELVKDSPDPVRYGGIAEQVCREIAPFIKHEVRSCTLGHIQRGGEPTAFDRILSVRYAVKAVELIEKKQFGRMVCLQKGEMDSVNLEDVIGAKNKLVESGNELVEVAKNLGVSFGI